MPFTHELQGTTPTEIDATDVLQFAGSTGFDSRIKVDEYNESTHVKTSGGANKSSANTPRNNQFVTASTISVDGAAAVNLNTIENSDAALKINFSDSESVAVEEAKFFSYDGSDTAVAITGLNFRAAEVGDTNWTEAEGSASALDLGDKETPATSHDYFIAVSASPTSVGAKTGSYRIELTYF